MLEFLSPITAQTLAEDRLPLKLYKDPWIQFYYTHAVSETYTRPEHNEANDDVNHDDNWSTITIYPTSPAYLYMIYHNVVFLERPLIEPFLQLFHPLDWTIPHPVFEVEPEYEDRFYDCQNYHLHDGPRLLTYTRLRFIDEKRLLRSANYRNRRNMYDVRDLEKLLDGMESGWRQTFRRRKQYKQQLVDRLIQLLDADPRLLVK